MAMRNYIWVFLIGATITLVSGCSVFHGTIGEMRSGYTYVPIDPFSVGVVSCTTTNVLNVSLTGTNVLTLLPDSTTNVLNVSSAGRNLLKVLPDINISLLNANLAGSNLLKVLPDNAVRIAVEQLDASGNISYGPSGVSVKGSSYKVTIDYINADTANVRLFMIKSVRVKLHKNLWETLSGKGFYRESEHWLRMTDPLPPGSVPGSEHYDIRRVGASAYLPDKVKLGGTTNEVSPAQLGAEVNIPVYIGIGLRVTADILTYSGNVNISGLGAIGVAADAKKLSGSLVVQTLGINGKSIAGALPIQSELNQTTVQNAIVAVGAIKTLLYDGDTVALPRVVGLYLPFAGGKPLVNAIISELSKEPVEWHPVRRIQN